MIHVLPVNDLREHQEATTCHCGPRVEIEDDDGTPLSELLVVHNSYDGREAVEWANDVLDADHDGPKWETRPTE